MCGIAGFSGRFQAGLLEAMSRSLAHRGPDDAGAEMIADCGVGLAHRRLSIIDLSPRGHQPMWDASERAAIAYNGELYNYRELRDELRRDGFKFRSDSDTEVLLNLYLRDGPDMLSRMNGIFAFAICDRRSGELFLARDGVGVKPLYYADAPEGLLFASELKALLAHRGVDRSLDPEAVRFHMLYLWCPSPHTMLRSVRKLEPGHAMLVRDGRIQRHWRYYDLPYSEKIVELPAAQAAEAVREHLRQAVERQLVSDVPIGAFLSGGLDSSAVVALAQRALGERRIQCFTIGFEAKAARIEGMAEDLRYARWVARHLGVDLHTIWVGPEMVDEVEKMIYYLDEPQADPASINAFFISQLARQHGIKVLLSGVGGDDIFTGYRRHHALQREGLWSWLPDGARGLLARTASDISPRTEIQRRVAKALRFADFQGDERIASYFFWIDPARLWALFSPDMQRALVPWSESEPLRRALLQLPADAPAVHRMLYLEGKFFLTDHNLNYADKTSMANGVEVRVPMLDPDLMALAARLPVRYKQRGHVGKWILKKAMEPVLPREVIHRRKAGFGAPLRHWLRRDLSPVVDDLLSESSLRRRGLFDPAAVRTLLERDRAQREDAAYTIFSMMCVEMWCRMFVDAAVPEPPAALQRREAA